MRVSEGMLEEGLEPTLLSEPDPKSGASANFATRAVSGVERKFCPAAGSGKRKKSGGS
jgi:hypothetical protein